MTLSHHLGKISKIYSSPLQNQKYYPVLSFLHLLPRFALILRFSCFLYAHLFSHLIWPCSIVSSIACSHTTGLLLRFFYPFNVPLLSYSLLSYPTTFTPLLRCTPHKPKSSVLPINHSPYSFNDILR